MVSTQHLCVFHCGNKKVTQGHAPFPLPLGIKGNQSWKIGPNRLRGIPALQWLPGTGPGQMYMWL